MLTIMYDPVGGFSVPDGAARKWAQNVVKASNESKESDLFFRIGTLPMLNAIRLMIASDEISHESVALDYMGKKYSFDNMANIVGGWPGQMCSDGIEIVEDIVRLQIKKIKQKEKQK